ncbi:hypothetical protein LguiA_009971 [Lonicera macranthoides]
MEGFALSTTTTPSQSGGSNENDLNSDEMSSKLHKLKKPLIKHFMSPTISAATKAAAAVPRKKILAERNESSNFNFDICLQKAPNLLDSKTSSPMKPRLVRSSSSWLTPSRSGASEPDDDNDEQNICDTDSSLKPYDPVTSYTSPRPKFLRYNPNRLHQAFLPQENETSKEDLEFDARRRMHFDSQIAAAEEKEIADALNSVVDEEFEFDKNEGDQDNNGEEEEIGETEEESGGSLKAVLKFLLVIVALFLSTHYISSMNSPTPSPTVEAILGLKDGYYGIQHKVFEAVNLKIFEGGNEPMETHTDGELEGGRVEDDNWGLVEESTDELGEVIEVQNGQSEDLCENELESHWEVSDQLVEMPETEKSEDVFDNELEGKDESFDHLMGRGLGESSEGAFKQQKIEETLESSDQLQEIESFQDHQIEGGGEEVVEDEIERAEEVYSSAIDEFGTPPKENEESDTVSLETDSNEAIIKPAKIESFPISIIAAPILFAIVACLGLVNWSRLNKTSVEDSPQPMVKNSIAESEIAEKISPVLFNVEEEEKIKRIESNGNPSSLLRSTEEVEASKEFSYSHVPTVELLGELVIGEVSSSLRSRGVKSKLLGTEESNNSVSLSHIRAASAMEFSTADSPSYGSCTAGKKIAKKEEAKDGEVSMLITTPVRRSSRLRNRAVTSP